MSYLSLIIHCVWSTKNRAPLLKNSHYRYELYSHIRKYSKSKGILIDHIGGFTDHMHLLLFLKSNQSVGEIERLIKGESSHWYSQMKYGPLQWQDDYFAVSVSPDRLNTVRQYIRKQEEHHKKYSFEEEYESFVSMLHKNNL
ncbi:IS200/IS605 family transposase [Parabacteroides sp. AM58-2XD]|jgi:putative transposase|uniref:IS200/IS605 family transposase n=1 Tax=Parabacteroides segnis TaxID=2763058 RepID=A0ABR7DXH6_9BACT|nr:IS200/IS605 family transposase [Parabacteroides segnis]RGY95422.1 IS200/IS605 family transposase [Parabacteroides sp. AM58-2XD]